MTNKPETVDAYIQAFAPEIQARLEAVRTLLRQLVPDGEERISYGMPALFRGRVVVYYAAFKRHLGLYPPVRDAAVAARVARYAGPKGNLQFPHDEALPLALIAEVAHARLAESRDPAAG